MIKNSLFKFLIPLSIGFILGFLIFQYFILIPQPSFCPICPTFESEKKANQGTEILFSKEYNSKKIEVDLSQQKMILFGDNKKLLEIKISSGKKESPTPTGNFRVIHKAPMIYSKATDCWLPFWVGFTEDGQYGFHELPICNGTRVGEKEISKPASLGCIRLKMEEAEKIYNFAEIGTVVEIYGQTP